MHAIIEQMEIRNKSEFPDGRKYEFFYSDEIDGSDLKIEGVRALCYCDKKLLIVNNKGHWEPPGGSVEENENYIDAFKREVREESNMDVEKYENIGFQLVKNVNTGKNYWLALFFCIVKPNGKFDRDPDNDITEIKLIEPSVYSEYFNWGEITDYIMPKCSNLLDKYSEIIN